MSSFATSVADQFDDRVTIAACRIETIRTAGSARVQPVFRARPSNCLFAKSRGVTALTHCRDWGFTKYANS